MSEDRSHENVLLVNEVFLSHKNSCNEVAILKHSWYASMLWVKKGVYWCNFVRRKNVKRKITEKRSERKRESLRTERKYKARKGKKETQRNLRRKFFSQPWLNAGPSGISSGERFDRPASRSSVPRHKKGVLDWHGGQDEVGFEVSHHRILNLL